MLLRDTQGKTFQYGITAACGAGFLLFGYDQGVFGGLLDNEPFLKMFGYPGATIQGQIVPTYDIGCIIGTLVSMYAGDKLGRRRSILIGCLILIVGAILQTASYSLGQMITGRQTETARPNDRGKLIIFQLVTNIFGIVIANWMNYGFTFIPHSSVSWRFPLAFQCFSIVTVALVLITPESPRWLIMKNRVSEAQNILARLLSKPDDHPSVASEINNLVAAVQHEAEVQKSVALKEIFTRNSKQQMLRCTNVIAYYLPVVLTRSVGLSSRMALILSAVDSMSLMFWGSMAALLIDRVGRKKLMLMGVAASSVCFALVAVGLRYGGPDNKGMSIMAVVFIFVYYVFCGMPLLLIPYIYPAEINSQKTRNIGTSFATTVNWLFVYVVVVATPTAIQNIQWRYYMLYAIFNFCFIPLIHYFYVETATLSLEQVDRLFEIKYEAGKDMSWADATRIARTESDDLQMSVEKDGIDAEHCEIAPLNNIEYS
ncbi:general substrate transporter [Aspergillus tetrazonus]